MRGINLRSLHYEPEVDTYRDAPSLAASVAHLGCWIGDLIVRHAGPALDDGAALVICSTTICDLIVDCEDLNAGFRASVLQRCGVAVDQIISTYECASWGYALRYHARQHGAASAVLVIMDANLPHFEFWSKDQAWGRSGHGVLVASLGLVEGFDEHLRVGHAAPGKGLHTFARVLQSAGTQWRDGPIFVPFLTPAMQPVMQRLAVQPRLAPNLYSTYGHCFGSDPWIGLRAYLQAGSAQPGEVTIGSFALNGYFCLARITVQPGA